MIRGFVNWTVVCACIGLAALAGAQPADAPVPDPLTHPSHATDFASLPPFGYTRLTTSDAYGRTIECYLSSAPDADPRPLVVSVQGSGCSSVFGLTDSGQVYGGLQNVVLGDFGDRVRVLVVEKPGVSFGDRPDHPGVAEGCPEVFLREHTVERWTEALRASIAHAVEQPGVDPDRVLILGHSEGADMAAHVAAADPELVSHIALLAGAGVSQLFDMMVLAGQPRSDDEPEADRNARVLEVLATWQRIAADPDSTTMMAWGHPYRRWSSFMANSSAASLERIATTTPMFLAQGTADRSSPIESFDAAVARVLVAGGDPVIRRVPGVDHGFAPVGAADSTGQGHGIDGLKAIMAEAVEWFLADARAGPAEPPATGRTPRDPRGAQPPTRPAG